MRVRKPVPRLIDCDETSLHPLEHPLDYTGVTTSARQEPDDAEKPMAERPSSIDIHHETIDFSNSRLLSFISYAIWSVVVVANGYAITMLAMNKTGKIGH